MNALFTLMLSRQVHSGVWQRFCEGLISNDPYQYEVWPDEYLKRAIDRLEIRAAWKRLDQDGLEQLKHMRATLAFRERMAQ